MCDFWCQIGLRNIESGWMEVIIFVIAVGSLIVIASVWTGNFWIDLDDGVVTPRELKFYKSFFIHYPIWGFFQQAVVFLIFFGVRSFFPPSMEPWVAPVAALIFSLMHLPNFHLMFTVGFMVSIFVVHMEIHHNLLAIGVAHGMMGALWKFLPPKVVSTKFNTLSGYVRVQKELQEKIKGIV